MMNDWFAKRIAAKVPPVSQTARQTHAVRIALEIYGCRDRAMRFLNRPAVMLGDMRPIDLAARDEAGLLTVIAMLQSLPSQES